MSSTGFPKSFHKSRANPITLPQTAYTSYTSPASSPSNRLSLPRSSCGFRPVKTPADHQANLQTIKDFSLGFATGNTETPLSIGTPNTRPTTSASSNLLRKKYDSPTNRFYIAPGVRPLSAFQVSEMFRRKKRDCSLSNVLSYSKEASRKGDKSVLSPEHFSMIEEKEKNMQSMMNSLFLKKEGHNAVKTPSHGKTTQASPNVTFSEGFSGYMNSKKVLLHSSSMKTPKSAYIGGFATNSTPYSPTHFPHMTPEEFSRIASPDINEEINANNISINNKKIRNDSAKERPRFLERKETNPKVLLDKVFEKVQKPTRPNTAKTSVISKRPQTATSFKLNTGLLRLNPKMPINQRTRLNGFITADFQKGLVYDDSMTNLNKNELKMDTFDDVKNYLIEKEQAKKHIHQVLDEYKRNVAINKSVINGSIVNISGFNKTQEEIEMPCTVNFEIMSPSSSYALKSTLYKNPGNAKLELKLNDEKKEHLKKFLAPGESQISISRQNTPKDIKEMKSANSTKKVQNEDNFVVEQENKIRNKIHRMKRIRKALTSRLKKLAKLGLTLKEVKPYFLTLPK